MIDSKLEKTLLNFFKKLDEENIEIYNEFSFQHELGIYLRSFFYNNFKVQFERNISFFDIEKENMEKKEMDICVFDNDKEKKCCIELKFPRNGQIPEQMYSFCKDIKFLEQLVEKGFSRGYFLAIIEEKSYFEIKSRSKNEIYKIFRENKIIEGTIKKPTGNSKKKLNIKGRYPIKWVKMKKGRYYLLIKIEETI